MAYSANIAYLAAENNAMEFILPKNNTVQTFDIHLPVSMLQQYAGESPIIDHLLHNIDRSRSTLLSPNAISLSPAILQTVAQMQNCTFDGFSRKMYLESKVYEIIALLHQQLTKPAQMARLTKTDQDKIREVAVYISEHLDHPLTVLELARRMGINQTKLKIGFKQLFGHTVFGYLQELRMARAKSYLLDTDLSIQEIGMLVGYSNSSNFSIAFKRSYGASPLAMRK